MNKDLISVIIPIYRVENYLIKCLNTVINQTYKNLEIILIDDGSDDKCPQICDEYAKKDKRIKVIHKKNEGLSAARNSGLDILNGKYIIFIDSDDYVSNTLIEILYKNLKDNDSDIAVANFYYVYKNKIESKDFPQRELIIDDNRKFKYLYDNDYNIASIVSWGKLYKRELFKNVRYPIGMTEEDEAVIFDLFKKAKRISYIDEKLYYYVQRNDSIMHKFNLKRLDAITIREERIKKIIKENLEKDILKREYFTYLYLLETDIIPGLKSIKELDLYRKNCKKAKEIAKEIRKKFTLTLKERIKIMIVLISPNLFSRITTRLNKK